MNAAAIDESQKAISQAEGVAKLTTLAFFFVPLSFTTSVFGLNFRELSDGNHLILWVWSITAAGTLILTYIALQWFALNKLRYQIKMQPLLGLGCSGRNQTGTVLYSFNTNHFDEVWFHIAKEHRAP